MPTFPKSVFWRGVEIQNLFSFVFQTLGIRAGKVETLNVSSFRAPGNPKLGTVNVPTFGFSPRFKGKTVRNRENSDLGKSRNFGGQFDGAKQQVFSFKLAAGGPKS